MLGDRNGRTLEDVAGNLLGAALDDEATETTEEHIISLNQGTLHTLHKGLYDGLNRCLLYTGALSDFANDICFCHITKCFIVNNLQIYVYALYPISPTSPRALLRHNPHRTSPH